VLNGFRLGTLSIYGQFRNKTTFYPVNEGAYVNTKNWYREETDLKIFLKAFSKGVCGQEYVIIRQKSCFTLERGSIQECVMMWLEYEEGMN
jgi:hypothetical protein